MKLSKLKRYLIRLVIFFPTMFSFLYNYLSFCWRILSYFFPFSIVALFFKLPREIRFFIYLFILASYSNYAFFVVIYLLNWFFFWFSFPYAFKHSEAYAKAYWSWLRAYWHRRLNRWPLERIGPRLRRIFFWLIDLSKEFGSYCLTLPGRFYVFICNIPSDTKFLFSNFRTHFKKLANKSSVTKEEKDAYKDFQYTRQYLENLGKNTLTYNRVYTKKSSDAIANVSEEDIEVDDLSITTADEHVDDFSSFIEEDTVVNFIDTIFALGFFKIFLLLLFLSCIFVFFVWLLEKLLKQL